MMPEVYNLLEGHNFPLSMYFLDKKSAQSIDTGFNKNLQFKDVRIF